MRTVHEMTALKPADCPLEDQGTMKESDIQCVQMHYHGVNYYSMYAVKTNYPGNMH
ncbi:hypothetical protein SERLA73DRAFT_179923 [Serpula lacrymans var. lacrymans S7.3]|uniref:Uncharacterized protein n=1 Tax=Serpula lacrymans var. lacrymans (strain S7.3) TaxID=936435 RepID=F8PUY2_SERL3|nr:hypothetical protein SERLA73DRAFT_179923 [Serpula lacrymans var. lacrymans S7.3]